MRNGWLKEPRQKKEKGSSARGKERRKGDKGAHYRRRIDEILSWRGGNGDASPGRKNRGDKTFTERVNGGWGRKSRGGPRLRKPSGQKGAIIH